MKFLTKAGLVGPRLIKGEVDDRSLRSQRPQRDLQAVRPGAGLKNDIGARDRTAMPPARLACCHA